MGATGFVGRDQVAASHKPRSLLDDCRPACENRRTGTRRNVDAARISGTRPPWPVSGRRSVLRFHSFPSGVPEVDRDFTKLTARARLCSQSPRWVVGNLVTPRTLPISASIAQALLIKHELRPDSSQIHRLHTGRRVFDGSGLTEIRLRSTK